MEGVAAAGPAARVEAILAPALADMGYDIVRVLLSGRGRVTLQVMAERKDGEPMTLEDCEAISRQASALLDVADPIAGAYALEISSPGIDRPLTRPEDFTRFAGHEARLETMLPIDGRRRFQGLLRGLDAEARVLIDTQTGPVALPLSAVQRAKLVLTDALLAAAAGQRH